MEKIPQSQFKPGKSKKKKQTNYGSTYFVLKVILWESFCFMKFKLIIINLICMQQCHCALENAINIFTFVKISNPYFFKACFRFCLIHWTTFWLEYSKREYFLVKHTVILRSLQNGTQAQQSRPKWLVQQKKKQLELKWNRHDINKRSFYKAYNWGKKYCKKC